MNSSDREMATAASAESSGPEISESSNLHDDSNTTWQSDDADGFASSESEDTGEPQATLAPGGEAEPCVPEFDLNDFDDEFDDDFEAETAGEYELDDDEYARALLDIVDFEIEGLEGYRDED